MKKINWYNFAFYGSALGVALLVFFLMYFPDKPTQSANTSNVIIDGFLDTTFTMTTRSSDAIVMSFDVKAKLTDRRDLFEVQNTIYRESLSHSTLWFYNATIDGTINDNVRLVNGTIVSMAFEQYFMDLVNRKDSLDTPPITTKVNKPMTAVAPRDGFDPN